MAVPASEPLPIAAPGARWIQLGLGLVAMMAISSPQYVWTLFTKSFQDNLGATLPAIQITFSLLIVLQTWLSPLQGYLVDKFGPRLLIAIGCLLSGAGWVLSAGATSLFGLYLTYGLFCGVGTGIVYVGIVGLMVRWFPDRRGLYRGRRRRIRFRRDRDDIPDRFDAEERGLPAHADRVRHHSRPDRCGRGIGDADAERKRCPAAGAHYSGRKGRRAAHDAAAA